MAKKVIVNRAPVLALWATIVAERLGYARSEALTLGKAVAGLNAQSKGQRLGIYEPQDKTPAEKKKGRSKEGPDSAVQILGRLVPATRTEQGLRATLKGQAIEPESVERYLAQKFGEDLGAVQTAMRDLARAHKPAELATHAYALYEEFRPKIPEGKRGWGAKGELDLGSIRSLAKTHA